MSQDKEFFTTFFIIMGGLAVFAIILVIIASNLTSDVTDYKPEEIVVENIKPVGEVYIAGESEPDAAPAPAHPRLPVSQREAGSSSSPGLPSPQRFQRECG